VESQQLQPQETTQTTELTPEDLELVDLYRTWKERLFLYELPDLYTMLGDIMGAIVINETEDFQEQIDELRDALNETRSKINLPPLAEDEDEDETEEGEE